MLRSDVIFVPLAVAYLVLLLQSWQPDTLSLMMPGSLAEGFEGKPSIPPAPRQNIIILLPITNFSHPKPNAVQCPGCVAGPISNRHLNHYDNNNTYLFG